MTRPVFRLMWKGSTGIPRLLVSCIRTIAALPGGMCLNHCKSVGTISEYRLTLAFSLLPDHRSYQSNSRSPSPWRVHRYDLDVLQSSIRLAYLAKRSLTEDPRMMGRATSKVMTLAENLEETGIGSSV
jgi:hypothetical protein